MLCLDHVYYPFQYYQNFQQNAVRSWTRLEVTLQLFTLTASLHLLLQFNQDCKRQHAYTVHLLFGPP